MEIEGQQNEQPTHERIDWSYPQIYDRKKLSSLTIGLIHTRAADDIRIKYDSDRDGWIVEQASIFQWPADAPNFDQDWQEVAFIKAWAREKKTIR